MPELSAALSAFSAAGVDFILVGGMAAALHGADDQLLVIDLLYARHPENIRRLLRLLSDIEAVFRTDTERQLHPAETHLGGSGRVHLMTRFGPVDLLTTIGPGLDHRSLLSESRPMTLPNGRQFRVLRSEKLIEISESQKHSTAQT